MKVRTGSCRWMNAPKWKQVRTGRALLRIETETGAANYWVASDGTQHVLQKQGTGETYTISFGRCNCPDAQKGNLCKHSRAIRAALAKITE